MNTNKVSDSLIWLDKVCDYVPLASTVSNLTDLFEKTILKNVTDPKTITQSHYFTYIDKKSSLRCVILLIPIIGNIIVGIYDFYNFKIEQKLENFKHLIASASQDKIDDFWYSTVIPALKSLPNSVDVNERDLKMEFIKLRENQLRNYLKNLDQAQFSEAYDNYYIRCDKREFMKNTIRKEPIREKIGFGQGIILQVTFSQNANRINPEDPQFSKHIYSVLDLQIANKVAQEKWLVDLYRPYDKIVVL